jgi:hypothetical protein
MMFVEPILGNGFMMSAEMPEEEKRELLRRAQAFFTDDDGEPEKRQLSPEEIGAQVRLIAAVKIEQFIEELVKRELCTGDTASLYVRVDFFETKEEADQYAKSDLPSGFKRLGVERDADVE